MARLLTIMGSGETAPTMVKVHRRLMEAVGVGPDGTAVLLDTPYGFQENADDISGRAETYFHNSVGHPISVASWRHRHDDAVVREQALAAIAEASYVFAGPGSPTYALEQWRGTALRSLLLDKLRSGGAVTFASAAALTLGVRSVPVYEIYKAGFAPWWEEGLDLFSDIGLSVAVIPHYDNAEGGHHDTRYCYLGERRLSLLEPELPEGAWVLGVDEHTALVLDLDERTAAVEGHGTVTLRSAGVSDVLESGATIDLDHLRPGATPTSASGPTRSPSMGTSAARNEEDAAAGGGASPAAVGLGADTERLTTAFDSAVEARDARGAVAATLELEQALVDWSADTLQSDEVDRARAGLRRMIVRLGELAEVGVRDPADVVRPFVDAVLDARVRARKAEQYELADVLRDRLTEAGVEVRDTPEGTKWLLTDDPR